MIIPDPGRLFFRKLRPPHSNSSYSLSGGLLAIGALGLVVAAAIAGGLAYSWLAIPAGLLGWVAIATLSETSFTILGIIESIFYPSIAFIFTDGLDRADSTPSWIASSIVALLFLWATWKEHRGGH